MKKNDREHEKTGEMSLRDIERVVSRLNGNSMKIKHRYILLSGLIATLTTGKESTPESVFFSTLLRVSF